MPRKVEQGTIIHSGLDGFIRVDEESLLRPPKVQDQIAAAEELARSLGLTRVGGGRAMSAKKANCRQRLTLQPIAQAGLTRDRGRAQRSMGLSTFKVILPCPAIVSWAS